MSYLLNRSIGSTGAGALQRPETSLYLHGIRLSHISFRYSSTCITSPGERKSTARLPYPKDRAHETGINSITVDKFEGRYLLSGGSDSSIILWDLHHESSSTCRPLASLARTASKLSLGVTHVSYYPFDSRAFLTSSYDNTIKLFDTESFTVSATFDLGSTVYFHALSPVAQHLLVASATKEPAVRLTDLRSGTSAHSLLGHRSPLLSVAWSPIDDHVLASGDLDGTVRLWDIRKSSRCLGILNMDDDIGITTHSAFANRGSGRESAVAHKGAVNGLCWTDDGRYLVSAGHDQRVRVWEVETGANTLSNFGPLLKNSRLSPLLPVICPRQLVCPGKDIVFIPNDEDLLMCELLEGKLLKRFRWPSAGPTKGATGGFSPTQRQSRVTALSWQFHGIGLYSAHADGMIRCWQPWTRDGTDLEENSDPESQALETTRKRKRQALEDIYDDLQKNKTLFS